MFVKVDDVLKISCPPFLHMGAVRVESTPGALSSDEILKRVESEWQNISARLACDSQLFRIASQRIASRSQDPGYPYGPMQVFYTVTSADAGVLLLEFYI